MLMAFLLFFIVLPPQYLFVNFTPMVPTIQCVLFCIWLLSFNNKSMRVTYVHLCAFNSFSLLQSIVYSVVQVKATFLYPIVDEYLLELFPIFAKENKAAVNIPEHVSWCTFLVDIK